MKAACRFDRQKLLKIYVINLYLSSSQKIRNENLGTKMKAIPFLNKQLCQIRDAPFLILQKLFIKFNYSNSFLTMSHIFQEQQIEKEIHDDFFRQSIIQIPSSKQEPLTRHNLVSKLNNFQDDELINLQTSIPILRATGILLEMESFEEVKIRLEMEHDESSRLRQEAKYLYYLWQLINEEQIDCRQLKQIIKFTLLKDRHQLEKILIEIYNTPQQVEEYIDACEFLQERSSTSKSKVIHQPVENNFFSFENRKEVLYPKQNSYYMKQSKSSNIASPILSKSSGKKNALVDTTNFIPSHFNYTIQLSSDQQKQLVSRLYINDRYKKREEQKLEMEKKKAEEELKQCTFKPNTSKRGRSVSTRGKSISNKQRAIKGFDKAVSRIKAGTQKNKVSQALRDYKPIGENYEKIRNKGSNPPKFLDRKKQEEKILFIISFDLGKYKTNVKIREGDTEESVAERLCKIYSLKQQFYDEICEIVRSQLQAYYMELYENEATGNYQYDM